jgi:hypothetical protein
LMAPATCWGIDRLIVQFCRAKNLGKLVILNFAEDTIGQPTLNRKLETWRSSGL